MTMTISDLMSYCQGSLIPLHPGKKTPTDHGWTVAPSPIKTAQDANVYRDLGYNLGYRIPKGILVIDVDPKNGGDETFSNMFPSVQRLPRTTNTPSGGWHIYTQLPHGTDPTSLRKNSKDYPGIDFLRVGAQVVMPGSTLGTGKDYHLSADAILPLPVTPSDLLEAITRSARSYTESDMPNGYLTTGELAQALEILPVELYADNDSWLTVAMASHHATNGEGLPAFLGWSLGDDAYAGQEELIRGRWESMSANRGMDPSITIGSLIYEMKQHGVCPEWLQSKSGILSDANDADSLFNPVSQDKMAAQYEEFETTITNEGNSIKLLTATIYMVDSDSILPQALKSKLLKQIAVKTNTPVGAITKDLRDLRTKKKQAPLTVVATPGNMGDLPDAYAEMMDTDSAQVHLRVATGVLAALQTDSNGITPMHCAGSWWMWNKKFWCNSSAEDDIKRKTIKVAQNHGVPVTAPLASQITELAKIQVSVSSDTLQGDRESIRLYAPNTVVEFDRATGQWSTIEHDHRHRNLSVIATAYDEDATEPYHWLKFLESSMTSPQAQRTLACAIIYSMSGVRPWLRKAFYFYGPPRSGKSTCLDAIESMIGQHNCSALNFSQFAAKNSTERLVGKLANISNETMSKKAINDEVFKALVSGESIMVERKYGDPYAYRNTAKLLAAGNGFPRIEDESEAVWDRLVLLSFPNACPEAKADHALAGKIASERSAILSWAMAIFAEEYIKDECRSAMHPDEHGLKDIDRWRQTNNPALQWAKERLIVTEDQGDMVSIDQAFADYTSWCARDGHHRSAKNHFGRHVKKAVRSMEDKHRKSVFIMVKLADLDMFNLD